MQLTPLQPRAIEAYAASAGVDALADLRRQAEPFRGLRVLHTNATPNGGGVAEILHAQIPLLRDLGLEAEWQTIADRRGDAPDGRRHRPARG